MGVRAAENLSSKHSSFRTYIIMFHYGIMYQSLAKNLLKISTFHKMYS